MQTPSDEDVMRRVRDGDVARALDLEFAFISLSAGVTETHLFGRLLPKEDGKTFGYVESPFVRIFHALRHTFITRLVKAGVNVRVAQDLARHSTPVLTLGRYTHVEVVDRTKALDALPAIALPTSEREALGATGTADASPSEVTAPETAVTAPETAASAPGRSPTGATGQGVYEKAPDRANRAKAAETANRRNLARSGAYRLAEREGNHGQRRATPLLSMPYDASLSGKKTCVFIHNHPTSSYITGGHQGFGRSFHDSFTRREGGQIAWSFQ